MKWFRRTTLLAPTPGQRLDLAWDRVWTTHHIGEVVVTRPDTSPDADLDDQAITFEFIADDTNTDGIPYALRVTIAPFATRPEYVLTVNQPRDPVDDPNPDDPRHEFIETVHRLVGESGRPVEPIVGDNPTELVLRALGMIRQNRYPDRTIEISPGKSEGDCGNRDCLCDVQGR